MSLSQHEFPVTLKNITANRRVVGSLWFAPNGELVVSEQAYNISKRQIDYSLGKGNIVVVTEEEDVLALQEGAHIKEEVIMEPPDQLEDKEEDEEEVEHRSIVDRFVDKEVHWTAVRKYVDELSDMRELESLLVDAQFHGLTDDSVIVKSINDRISILDDNK